MSEESRRVRKWEWVLLGSAAFVSLSSLGALIADFPVRSLFMEIDAGGEGRTIGVFKEIPAPVRRQRASEHEFRSVRPEESVFDRDSVVTGPDAGAVIELSDGARITLGPNTMIRLSFGSGLGLNGVFRQGFVDVLEGEVSGSLGNGGGIVLRSGQERVDLSSSQGAGKLVSKPQNRVELPRMSAPVGSSALILPPAVSSAPEPASATLPEVREALVFSDVKAPLDRGEVKLSAREFFSAQGPQKRVSFEWRTNLPDGGGILQIDPVPTASLPMRGVESVSERVASVEGRAQFQFLGREPGLYRWAIVNPETGKPAIWIKDGKETSASGEFQIDREVIGIDSLQFRTAGVELKTNEYQGGELIQADELTLEWKAVPRASAYIVESDGFKKQVQGSRIAVPAAFALKPGNRFRVSAVFPPKSATRFKVVSSPQGADVLFNPPVLVEPSHQKSFSIAQLSKKSNGSLLMTWKKTHLTRNYELLIASDAEFKSIILDKKLKDNFFLLKAGRPGSYFWKVRSLGEGLESAYTQAQLVTLTP